ISPTVSITFDVSHTGDLISIFHPLHRAFDTSPTQGIFRWFTHRLSIFHPPSFDGLHTGRSESARRFNGLAGTIHSVTLYLTDI
ncbi:MAG: hypothetical protein KDB03_28745, partial [Planctomycetales bacterium]|nr:hypothetical protein [Planctomycetales bacterium]